MSFLFIQILHVVEVQAIIMEDETEFAVEIVTQCFTLQNNLEALEQVE